MGACQPALLGLYCSALGQRHSALNPWQQAWQLQHQQKKMGAVNQEACCAVHTELLVQGAAWLPQ